MTDLAQSVTYADIAAAHDRIRPHIHRTPILTCATVDRLAGARLFFKCENFQRIGAFKARGALNAALAMPPAQAQRGLTTHSSGNHAQAVALAARQLGVPAMIVMPSSAPGVKVQAVRDYGAEVILCEPNQAARERTVQEVAQRTGATFIHPYDHPMVIAGQGTCAKELIENHPDLDIMLTPVGGGGLLSGTSIATRALLPQAAIHAGEPEGAADAVLSFQSGRVEKAPFINTIADGLMTTLSERTLAIIRANVTAIHLVGEEDIARALRLVYERMKIIIEPSCAVPLAAVLKYPSVFQGKRIGIILTGGNVELSSVAAFLQSHSTP
jgi:threonine dehydratase